MKRGATVLTYSACCLNQLNSLNNGRCSSPSSSGAGRPRQRPLAPDPARAATGMTSKFWGVTWDKREQRWKAYYHDANGKRRQIGLYDTQEAAAHAVNAAIRRAGLVGKRRTNAVVDGHLVPRETHKRRGGKRRRDEPAASSSRGRRRR